jgi:hypothetical protein
MSDLGQLTFIRMDEPFGLPHRLCGQLEQPRRQRVGLFPQHGAGDHGVNEAPLVRLADAAPTGESLLTLAGYYVGREFKFARVRAVWTASQGQIKFYDDDGAVLLVVDLSDPRQAKAA